LGYNEGQVDSICTACRQLGKASQVPDNSRHEWRNNLSSNRIGNVEHNEHMIIVQYKQLVGRSEGENMTNSSSGSLHTTRVPGCIRMHLGKSFAGTRCVTIYESKKNEFIRKRIELTGSALFGSSTGSSSQCEADPGLLGSDLKLNFGYVVEDIKTHLLKKESPHFLG
jgi:hypothetical protein